MDILDILLDILLKPPQPFIGLFFLINVHSHLSIHCHKEIKASGLAKKANYLTLLRRVYIKT